MSLQSRLDALLAEPVQAGQVPNLFAIVGDRAGLLYAGAAGPRALGGNVPMGVDTVIWLASTSKAITTVAAMQCVEQRQFTLDAPASAIVPELAEAQVLEGFDDAGKPRLRPPRRPVTLRHLLSHTSGFTYEFSSAPLVQYMGQTGLPSMLQCRKGALNAPLMFDPGDGWEYGIGIDWAGQMVERVSGKSLGNYLADHVCGPLGMASTSFLLSDTQRSRLAAMHAKTPDGALATMPFEMPQPPEFEMGGGALYGTAQDYLRFMRMLLNGGELDGVRVLRTETVAEMFRDQCPDFACGAMPSVAPALSYNADFFPGQRNGWSLSFLVNRNPVPGGRSAGSLAWAGLSNVYYWIDPTRGIATMFGTQMLPFFEPATVAALRAFETTLYANL
ncbi:MAG: serine hydrolase domain-containing protein [Gammaproteobacteria bacterium]